MIGGYRAAEIYGILKLDLPVPSIEWTRLDDFSELDTVNEFFWQLPDEKLLVA